MIKIPTECPECFSPLIRVNDQLFCRNANCSAQETKKVEKFAKAMRILGLGPSTIKKLGIQSIPDIYALNEDFCAEILGEKTSKKLIENINNSLSTELSTLIEAFSIPLIGGSAAKQIASVITSIEDISEETCKQANLGPKRTENILLWLNNIWPLYSFIPFNFITRTYQETSSIVVCFSGKFSKTKSELAKELEPFGVTVSSTLTKKVNYLVTEETSSTKITKAKQYGIDIVSLETIKNILGDNK